MITFRHFLRAGAACAVMLSMLPAAHAQSQSMSYADMCVKAADMPKPYGEWDLKGNAKLPAYCKCFAPKFEARAMKSLQAMQAGAKAPPLEQSNKEELELRNSCRKQTGLPLAVEPK